MASRKTVCLRLPSGERLPARTDLAGHGDVGEGEEFVARELWPQGDRLLPGGRVLRVRVLGVLRVSRRHHVLDVAVLEDRTARHERRGLFTQEGQAPLDPPLS